METLTQDNARIGLAIRSKTNPEWGIYTLQKDRNGWMYSSPRATAMLDVAEFKFWEVVPRMGLRTDKP
jgi:hypothetical protein